MAKKSNKTDHVLGLLSNAGVGEDSLKKIRVPSEKSKKTIITPLIVKTIPKEQKKNIQHQQFTKYTVQNQPKQPVQILSEQVKNNKQEQIKLKKLVQVMQIKAEEAMSKKQTEPENSTTFQEKRSVYSHINIVEDVVAKHAKEMVKQLGICKCSRCYNDILALALNQLPTYYLVVLKGNVFSKMSTYEKQNSAHVAAAVTRACMVVKNNPNH